MIIFQMRFQLGLQRIVQIQISFFVTNQRYFFWEYSTEFQSEDEAVDFFKNHLNVFRDKRKEILSSSGGWDVNAGLFLENTKERFV